MLGSFLKDIRVILGSQSPRRKELLASLDIDFEVIVKNIDESVPDHIKAEAAAEYVAKNKLVAFQDDEYKHSLIITADTVVVDGDHNILGKPSSAQEAIQVIQSLSNKTHKVFTGVAVSYEGKVVSFTEETIVCFEELSTEEILYYVEKYKPFDKAGSYGIQEWIGRVAVSRIEGSYENVMGLPTVKLYQTIKVLIKKEA